MVYNTDQKIVNALHDHYDHNLCGIYVRVTAGGTVRIGDTEFQFGPRDVFVVPSWAPVQLAATDDVVMFSFSDRPVQAALDLLREERV